MGKEFLNELHHIYDTQQVPGRLNQTQLVLIPKEKEASTVNHFRPISLCNALYKVIAKVLVNQLRPWLNDLIHPAQAGFIPRRKAKDNVLLVNKILHSFNKKNAKRQWMMTNLDLDKAYDRIEWDYIHWALVSLQFPP